MSAAQNPSSEKTADELLAALLTEREYAAVLRYSRDNGLEEDSAVYFLVALLKLFALAYDRILESIATAEQGRQHIEATTIQAVLNIDRMLGRRAIAIKTALTEATDHISVKTAELHAATGELRAARDEMQKITTEAAGTYRAYKRLADDGSGKTLSQLFQKAALDALDSRVPVFDGTIRSLILDTISQETGKFRKTLAIQSVVLITLFLILFFGN